MDMNQLLKIRMPRLHELDSNAKKFEIKEPPNEIHIEETKIDSYEEKKTENSNSDDLMIDLIKNVQINFSNSKGNINKKCENDRNTDINFSTKCAILKTNNAEHLERNEDNTMYDHGNGVGHNGDNIPTYTGVDLVDHYFIDYIVGSGKFGKVSKVKHRETERIAAAKEIQYKGAKSREEILYEIDILRQLYDNPYILTLYEVIDCCTTSPAKLIIITEYLDGGDLFEQIAKDDMLTESQVRRIMKQIVEGVAFIHSKEIIHRDLKPENIIYESKSNNKIKIIDFGFAVRFDKKNPPRRMVGTTLFVAPEVFKHEDQSYETDTWSLGVLAYDLLAGITPFEVPRSGDLDRELDDNEIINNIIRCDYDFEDDGFIGISDYGKSFIADVLITEPCKRMSSEACLQHPWLCALDQTDGTSLTRSVTVKRMKNYIALKKWGVRHTVIMPL